MTIRSDDHATVVIRHENDWSHIRGDVRHRPEIGRRLTEARIPWGCELALVDDAPDILDIHLPPETDLLAVGRVLRRPLGGCQVHEHSSALRALLRARGIGFQSEIFRPDDSGE